MPCSWEMKAPIRYEAARASTEFYADGDDLLIDGGAGGAEVYLTSLAVVKLGGVPVQAKS